MAKWYDDLKASRVKGAGFVEVVFDGADEPTRIPLRRPRGRDKERAAAVLDSLREKHSEPGQPFSVVEGVRHNEAFSIAILRACLRVEAGDAEPDDDELSLLVSVSGGAPGALLQRCVELLGDGFEHMRNEAPTTRGRSDPAPADDGGAGGGADA